MIVLSTIDDEIIYPCYLNFVEWFDSTFSTAINVLIENLDSLSSLSSQHNLPNNHHQ